MHTVKCCLLSCFELPRYSTAVSVHLALVLVNTAFVHAFCAMRLALDRVAAAHWRELRCTKAPRIALVAL